MGPQHGPFLLDNRNNSGLLEPIIDNNGIINTIIIINIITWDGDNKTKIYTEKKTGTQLPGSDQLLQSGQI